MRIAVVSLVLGVFFSCVGAETVHAQLKVKAMTWNIRYNNPDDGVNAWPKRKKWVKQVIQDEAPDILGIQEGLKEQVDYLGKGLKDYYWYGKGRDDGKEAGEYSAIFWRKDKFRLKTSGTFWLSETPDKPGSKGWDAACNRLVSWVMLTDAENKKLIYVFNTHFDHKGKTAKLESAKLLDQKVKEIAREIPAIVMGDFNFDLFSEGYRILNTDLEDTRKISDDDHVGPDFTANRFDVGFTGDHAIDHIFIKGTWELLSHTTLAESKDGRYPSDHFPVIVELNKE